MPIIKLLGKKTWEREMGCQTGYESGQENGPDDCYRRRRRRCFIARRRFSMTRKRRRGRVSIAWDWAQVALLNGMEKFG
jgi:hypothetical protein